MYYAKHELDNFLQTISDFTDHATFREKGVNTGLVRQTCGLHPFETLYLVKYDPGGATRVHLGRDV